MKTTSSSHRARRTPFLRGFRSLVPALGIASLCTTHAVAQSPEKPSRAPAAGFETSDRFDADAKSGGQPMAMPTRLMSPDRGMRSHDQGVALDAGSKGLETPLPSLNLGRRDPDQVDFVTGQDHGGLWVVGGGETVLYKARFAGAVDGDPGVTFIPRLGAGAPRNFPLNLRLRSIESAGRPLDLAPARLSHDEHSRRVELDHGVAVERYAAGARSIEQSFVFADLERLSANGDLVVELEVTTELAVEPRDEGAFGFAFRVAGLGGVDYGRAFALDATGRKVPVESTFDGSILRHTIPARFVATAVPPLVLDPEIAPISLGAFSDDRTHPDAGYEPSSDTYLIVHERDFSATDGDVYRVHVDAEGNALDAAWVDVSTDDYRRPSTAGKRIGASFLVAAQSRADANAPWEIRVRTVTATAPYSNGTLWNTVNGSETGNKLRPDVGGDYHVVGPTYWTVIWERVFSATDSDVHMRQVTTSGAPRGTGITFVENSGANQYAPRISEHCGDTQSVTQSHTIIWSESLGDNIYAETYDWNGNLVTSRFPISARGELDFDPDVSGLSEPIRGKRYFCATFRYGDTGLTRSIACVLFDENGTIYDDLLVANVFVNRSMLAPSIDCDGQRFVASCERQFVSPNAETDIFAWSMAIDADDFQLVRLDTRLVEASTAFEEAPDVACRYRDAEDGAAFEAVIVSTDDGPTPTTLNASLFTALQFGSLTTFPYGCGPVSLSVTGEFFPGGDVQATISGSVGPTGLLIGIPYATPLPCGPCTLGADGFSIGAPLSFTIPQDGSLVGFVTAIQGFELLTGPCLNTAQFTDMVTFVTR